MAYNKDHNKELYQKLKQTEGYRIYSRESIILHFLAAAVSGFLFVVTLVSDCSGIGELLCTGLVCGEFFVLFISVKALFNDIFKAEPVDICVGEVSDVIIKNSLGKEIGDYGDETAQLYFRIQTEKGSFDGVSPSRFGGKADRKNPGNPQNVVIGEKCYGFVTHNGERFIVK